MGLAIGIGAAFLAPLAGRMLAGAGKPVLRETIKGGLLLVEEGKKIVAETRETIKRSHLEALPALQPESSTSMTEASQEIGSVDTFLNG
jgi:hypothetical protein